jgi:hypothetical protein
MTWTTPRTWVAGETVTAALLNTHVRDNLNMVVQSATSGAGAILQSGTDTVSLSAAVTATKAITFATAFAAAPNVTVGSQFTTSGATDFVAGVDATVGNPTTTGFTVRVMSTTKISITTTARIYWVAVGT